MNQCQLLFAVFSIITIFCLEKSEAYSSFVGRPQTSSSSGVGIVSHRRSYGIGFKQQYASSTLLQLKSDDDEEEEDEEEDEFIDDAELGDWRRFRMNLSESGLSSSSSVSDDGYIDETDNDNDDDNDGDDDISTPSPVMKRPKSVSKSNEKLLMKQSKVLAEEYLSDVWAHEAPTVEVGGLLLRLPLEAELFRNQESSKLGMELQRILNLDNNEASDDTMDEDDDDDDTTSPSSTTITTTRGDDDDKEFSFSPLAAKTIFWYRKAKRILDKEMANIASFAENGEIDATKLPKSCQEFLGMYLDNQQFWQEVCLVIQCDDGGSSAAAKTLVINRPMAFSLSDNLAKLIINGAFGQVNAVARTELMVKLLMAYENATCGIYVGGPDNMDAPATIIHGVAGLEGAEEISPGCGIYQGGLKAAVNGILSGEHSPLDFRFFIGEHCYENRGPLDADIMEGKYQPVACARSVALKQCIQLPKPLWHEVMELCGGELREISKLEMMKRNDLSFEEVDDE